MAEHNGVVGFRHTDTHPLQPQGPGPEHAQQSPPSTRLRATPGARGPAQAHTRSAEGVALRTLQPQDESPLPPPPVSVDAEHTVSAAPPHIPEGKKEQALAAGFDAVQRTAGGLSVTDTSPLTNTEEALAQEYVEDAIAELSGQPPRYPSMSVLYNGETYTVEQRGDRMRVTGPQAGQSDVMAEVLKEAQKNPPAGFSPEVFVRCIELAGQQNQIRVITPQEQSRARVLAEAALSKSGFTGAIGTHVGGPDAASRMVNTTFEQMRTHSAVSRAISIPGDPDTLHISQTVKQAFGRVIRYLHEHPDDPAVRYAEEQQHSSQPETPEAGTRAAPAKPSRPRGGATRASPTGVAPARGMPEGFRAANPGSMNHPELFIAPWENRAFFDTYRDALARGPFPEDPEKQKQFAYAYAMTTYGLIVENGVDPRSDEIHTQAFGSGTSFAERCNKPGAQVAGHIRNLVSAFLPRTAQQLYQPTRAMPKPMHVPPQKTPPGPPVGRAGSPLPNASDFIEAEDSGLPIVFKGPWDKQEFRDAVQSQILKLGDSPQNRMNAYGYAMAMHYAKCAGIPDDKCVSFAERNGNEFCKRTSPPGTNFQTEFELLIQGLPNAVDEYAQSIRQAATPVGPPPPGPAQPRPPARRGEEIAAEAGFRQLPQEPQLRAMFLGAWEDPDFKKVYKDRLDYSTRQGADQARARRFAFGHAMTGYYLKHLGINPDGKTQFILDHTSSFMESCERPEGEQGAIQDLLTTLSEIQQNPAHREAPSPGPKPRPDQMPPEGVALHREEPPLAGPLSPPQYDHPLPQEFPQAAFEIPGFSDAFRKGLTNSKIADLPAKDPQRAQFAFAYAAYSTQQDPLQADDLAEKFVQEFSNATPEQKSTLISQLDLPLAPEPARDPLPPFGHPPEERVEEEARQDEPATLPHQEQSLMRSRSPLSDYGGPDAEDDALVLEDELEDETEALVEEQAPPPQQLDTPPPDEIAEPGSPPQELELPALFTGRWDDDGFKKAYAQYLLRQQAGDIPKAPQDPDQQKFCAFGFATFVAAHPEELRNVKSHPEQQQQLTGIARERSLKFAEQYAGDPSRLGEYIAELQAPIQEPEAPLPQGHTPPPAELGLPPDFMAPWDEPFKEAFQEGLRDPFVTMFETQEEKNAFAFAYAAYKTTNTSTAIAASTSVYLDASTIAKAEPGKRETLIAGLFKPQQKAPPSPQ